MTASGSVTSAMPLTVNPNRGPSSRSSSTDPAPRWPNRKFSPTTTLAACSRSTITSCTNSSALTWDSADGERQHQEGVDTELGDQLGAPAQGGQQRRMAARPDHLGRDADRTSSAPWVVRATDRCRPPRGSVPGARGAPRRRPRWSARSVPNCRDLVDAAPALHAASFALGLHARGARHRSQLASSRSPSASAPDPARDHLRQSASRAPVARPPAPSTSSAISRPVPSKAP